MNLSFLEIFVLISIIHCFLLSLVLLLSKYLKNSTNKYLGYTLLIIGIIGINNWFWDLEKNPTIVNLLDFFLWQFLYPVTLLIFFLKSVNTPLKSISKKLFFLPFILLSFFNVVITLQNVYEVYQIPFLTDIVIAGFYKLISFLSIAFPIIFLAISFKHLFLKPTKTNTKWLRFFWLFFLMIELYGFVLEFHRFLYLERKPLTYLWVVLSIFLYWLIYVGVYKFKLSNEQFEVRTFLKNKQNTKTITEENKHIQHLISLIVNDKIHHNPQLNRELIAEKLGISSGYLSQLIKATTYSNFSELINHFRIEDVKEMIVHPDFSNYSLLAIGLEVGFNSKATFYTAFKKATGLTPNQYKKANL